MDFISSLITLRKNNKLSQQDVANILNIARSTYNDIEHKKIKLSVEDFIKLCNFYNISPNAIINNNDTINIILSKQDLIQLQNTKRLIDKIDRQINNNYIIINEKEFINQD